MNKSLSQVVWTVGLLCVGGLALAGPAGSGPAKTGDANRVAPPQEPIGFVAGSVIGAFAAGPFGAVVGAGLGTWLGNRVHRAGEAAKAETLAASLQAEKSSLENRQAAMQIEKARLADQNRSLTVQVEQLSNSVKAAQMAKNDPAEALDGLQGDVLFRTGSAEINADVVRQIQGLAQAMTKSPELKIRIDGYADPRGGVAANLKLSEARANAVRDLLLASGVSDGALEVNAYGKSLSVADDPDGYALERRVRLTLQADGMQSASAGSGGVGTISAAAGAGSASADPGAAASGP
ncbi:MAG TPA: OmpA family protein [Steroidobacteraceae bacterium]|nr:OmpA family protein [Steroidobacteraceae bacterium]